LARFRIFVAQQPMVHMTRFLKLAAAPASPGDRHGRGVAAAWTMPSRPARSTTPHGRGVRGPHLAGADVRNEVTGAALAEFKKELQRMIDEPVVPPNSPAASATSPAWYLFRTSCALGREHARQPVDRRPCPGRPWRVHETASRL